MAQKSDPWPSLCNLVEEDDGLPTRQSGPWAEFKLSFWARYIDIATSAMSDHKKWNGLSYVDPFCGPGVCHIKDDPSRRFPGSPLIAAASEHPFRRLILCDKNPRHADACQERIQRITPCVDLQLFRDDSNTLIGQMVAQIVPGSLTLAIIDHTGLHASFDLVSTLASAGAVDLLVLVPDAYDILRNVQRTYLPDPDSNLDRFLGPDSNWRDEWSALGDPTGVNGRRLFATIYQRQLQRLLGYQGFGEKVISGPNGPMYRLIFASKHPRGLEFWDKVTRKDRSGQRDMF